MTPVHHYTSSERAFWESAYNSSSIIHDINSMMGIILVMAETIAESTPENERCHAYAAKIIRAVKRCTDLLSTLQFDVFGSRSVRQTVGINSLIEESAAWIRMSGKPVAVTEFIEKTAHVVVYGNATEIGAALMNICLNAIEAMPDGGSVTITTRLIDNPAVSEIPAAGTGKYVEINISDTGSGITPENVQRIFEPRFTTKPESDGKQRGMGLYRVRQCITSHGGTVRVGNVPGSGTTITLQLPAAGTKSSGVAEKSGHDDRRKIIVVDNNKTVSDVIESMLATVRMQVVRHEHPASAISWIEKNPGEASVAIVEYLLPGFDGLTCINTMKILDPALKYVLCSSIRDDIVPMEHDITFLRKPFLKNELLTAINRAVPGTVTASSGKTECTV